MAFGQVLQHQLSAIYLERRALAVDQDPRQVQVFAIQTQGLCRHIGVAAQHHFVEHAGFGRIEVKGQIDAVDPKRGGGVVSALHHGSRAFTEHGVFLIRNKSGSNALLERGFDERIQVAIQHFLCVGDFDVGAQVFDA